MGTHLHPALTCDIRLKPRTTSHISQARISASRLLVAEKPRPESGILHMDVADDNEPHNWCANTRAAAERPRQYLSGAQGPLGVAVGDYVGHIGPFSRDLSSIQERRRAQERSDLVRERNTKRADKIFHGACESPEQTTPRSYDQNARAQECVVTMEGA